jgi:hypothetical protein
MQFTVQYLGPIHAPADDHQWAVLIGNEHIIYTGSYRDCEDWLDQQENCTTRTRPTCQRKSTIRRGCVRAMLSSLLADEAGRSTPVHAVLMAAGLGVLFVIAATISENFASALVSLHHISAAGALVGYESGGSCGHRHSACDLDHPDIACALAPADADADEFEP